MVIHDSGTPQAVASSRRSATSTPAVCAAPMQAGGRVTRIWMEKKRTFRKAEAVGDGGAERLREAGGEDGAAEVVVEPVADAMADADRDGERETPGD